MNWSPLAAGVLTLLTTLVDCALAAPIMSGDHTQTATVLSLIHI